MTNLKVSIGCNKKVGSDTAIINMCSATNCPAQKLGMCQVGGHKKCYAMKAERMWKNTLCHRNLQEGIWKTITVQEAINDLESLRIKIHRDAYDHITRALQFIRFSEAGDFTSQDDVNKMSDIAEGLKGRLIFYGYTARKDLDFSKISDNMVVNGSGFCVDNEFKAVDMIPVGYPYVCSGNCRTCNLCKEKRGVKILVKMH